MEYKHILCTTDFSDYSDDALRQALELSKLLGARLSVVHVVFEPAEFSGFYVPHVSFEKIRVEIEEGARKMMDDLVARIVPAGAAVTADVLVGSPAEGIVAYAVEKGVDLIVIGSQGKRGIEKLVFGSTAEKVVKKAHCSVLCIKPRES